LVEAEKLYDQSRIGLQPVVLTNPSLTNQQMIVGTHNPGPQQGGNQGNSSQGVDPSVANIFMCHMEVELHSRAKNMIYPLRGIMIKNNLVTTESFANRVTSGWYDAPYS